ncbi:MAG TPA: RidA family protein, partial [Burkholderiales bacterium]|nr:RidA family protein [Burkholderiales bacterium]
MMTDNALTLMNPAGLYDPAPNGYSHVALVAAGARLVYIAGQRGETESGALVPDFRLQVRQALRNIGACLASAGAGPAQVLRTKIYVTDIDAYVQEGHAEWLAFFGEHLPA